MGKNVISMGKELFISGAAPLLRKVVYSRWVQEIMNFQPKVKIFLENRRFIVKTASDGRDLEKVLNLRHDVFYRELLKKDHPLGLDIDKYDFLCDHLMIIEKERGECIATYRLNSSLYSNDYYSATEFHMTSIIGLRGIKLELGRGCVHKSFRGGMAIAMIWKGIVEYIEKTETSWLFGCSSVKTVDAENVSKLWHYMKKKGYICDSFAARPRRKFKMKNLYAVEKLTDAETVHMQNLIPPLLKFYLKSGAVIAGEPVLDRAFQCVDFLTLFNTDDISAKSRRRFTA